MNWGVFNAIMSIVNLVIWMGVAHLIGRRIELAHKRADSASARITGLHERLVQVEDVALPTRGTTGSKVTP